MGLCNDTMLGPSAVDTDDDEQIPTPEQIVATMDYPDLDDLALQLFRLASTHRGSHDDWRIVSLVLTTYQRRMEAA